MLSGCIRKFLSPLSHQANWLCDIVSCLTNGDCVKQHLMHIRHPQSTPHELARRAFAPRVQNVTPSRQTPTLRKYVSVLCRVQLANGSDLVFKHSHASGVRARSCHFAAAPIQTATATANFHKTPPLETSQPVGKQCYFLCQPFYPICTGYTELRGNESTASSRGIFVK